MYTDRDFIAALEAAVAERGRNFRYSDEYPDHTDCWYTVAGEGACIIGLAIQKMTGFPCGADDNTEAASVLAELPDARFTPALREAANLAQARQDENAPWGEALASFYRKYASSETV